MSGEKREYFVTGAITISLHTVVEATSPEDAKKLAQEMPYCTLGDPERFGDTERDAWLHSGELDGDVFELEVEECEE